MQTNTPREDAQTVAIELRGLTKTFGPVIANDHIDLSVRKGEILSLLGENGSGKTTLMNMLSGIYRPDHGRIYVDGKRAEIRSPIDAFRLGIGMIHQHFKLVDVLSVADNIVLGTKAGRGANRVSVAGKIAELCKDYGLYIDPNRKIYDLSVSEKQTVEILKVLYRGARILILDEPTAVLTPQEIERLFVILRHMRAQGCAVILITHKLNEVMEVSDRIAILRRGKLMDTVVRSEVTVERLIEKMVGETVDLALDRPDSLGADKEPVLRVEGLSVRGKEGELKLKDVSFDIRPGEILGVAGVAGSGQKELCEKIAGLMPAEEGRITIHLEGQSKDITRLEPRAISHLGVTLAFVPEDRLGMGLVPSMDIVDNLLLKDYYLSPGPAVYRKAIEGRATKLVDDLAVLTPGIHTPVRRLSGGNVQKVLLGREISSQPKLLITAYPVRGLDIRSSYTIYDLLNAQKKRGVAVLFVGEDLDVLLGLCDRILVLCAGRVTDIVDARTVTKHQVGALMTDAGSIPSAVSVPEMNADARGGAV